MQKGLWALVGLPGDCAAGDEGWVGSGLCQWVEAHFHCQAKRPPPCPGWVCSCWSLLEPFSAHLPPHVTMVH